MKEGNYGHQGDIVFAPYKGELEGTLEKHNGRITVGWGEVTGHSHVLTVERPQDMEIVKVSDGFILRLKGEGTVTHNEHKPIKLKPGNYRIGNEREMDWFSMVPRKVVD